MKRSILYLQLRDDESREHEEGCIIRNGNFKPHDLEIVRVLDSRYKIPKPSDLDKYGGIITGASAQYNVTDWSPEIQKKVSRLIPFFTEVIRQDKPMLCICFGHQFVADTFGGKTVNDDDKSEVGTVEVTLTNEAAKDTIFTGIPRKFNVVVGHKDSVVKLPSKATLLASSKRCPIQAYKMGNNIYSVQFHPELKRRDLVWRLMKYPEYTKGRSIEEVKADFKRIPHATKILSNFKKIVQKKT